MKPDGKKPGVNKQGLGDALFPKIKRQLLAVFFTPPEGRYYGREISRLIEGSHGAVRRELKALVNAGILATERVGRHQYYWADPDCMVYSELKGLVRKTFGVADMLRAALLPIDDIIELAMVFGSVAAGTDTAKSDIDLLIIGKASFRQLATALGKTERGLGRSVNPVLFSRKDFRSKYRSDNHFVRTITESEKLFIKGSSDELAKLAGESLDKERSHN